MIVRLSRYATIPTTRYNPDPIWRTETTSGGAERGGARRRSGIYLSFCIHWIVQGSSLLSIFYLFRINFVYALTKMFSDVMKIFLGLQTKHFFWHKNAFLAVKKNLVARRIILVARKKILLQERNV